MRYLAIVSLIWAFSFGLIGSALQGLDTFFVAAARLGLAALVFIPFFRWSAVPTGSHARLLACGAIQFGLMYVFYMQAFRTIPSHLVALFSILTPLYVVLLHDLRQHRFHRKYLMAAALSILGAAIIKAPSSIAGSFWTGFFLMQAAGLSFAFGQVDYRLWKRQHPAVRDHEVFGLLYLGACLVAFTFSAFATDWSALRVKPSQLAVLSYLGIVASGVGFFLWNKGAARSRPGTLASFNNAVVPMAMACSLFIFGEISEIGREALLRLLIGSLCIGGAVLVTEKTPQES